LGLQSHSRTSDKRLKVVSGWPAAIDYASDSALCHIPHEHEWSFVWSTDGESVAIAKDGMPIACIVAAQKPGYSRALIKEGPWGNTWSDELVARTFS
jgi:hypothetical protein